MNEVIPYVHYSWVVHIYIYIYIYVCCLYYNTEPATLAVIACCERPVSLQEAALGLKTPSASDNCPIKEGRGLLSAVVSRVVPTFWKRANQKKTSASNIQADADRGKQTQMDRQRVSLDKQLRQGYSISMPILST